jgi:hypothetical protein
MPDHSFSENFEKAIALDEPHRFKLADSIDAFNASTKASEASH